MAVPGRRTRLLTASSWPDHFSGSADRYARYRPRYPGALFDRLAELAPARDLAWDCGTGNGQAAGELRRRFRRVVGTDASERQIAGAARGDGVLYAVALAEAAPLRDASADLATVAQAAHWLRLPEFYDEARRIVRPHGLVALWTYGPCTISPALDRAVLGFYHDVVGPYWPAERGHVDSLYRDLPFPFEEIALDAPPVEHSWTRGDFLGYVGTWSAVKRYREERDEDPVETILAPSLLPLWPEHQLRRVRWPIGLRLGRLA